MAVLAVYSYGWKVTEIEMKELFRDFHLVKPLVKELVSPICLAHVLWRSEHGRARDGCGIRCTAGAFSVEARARASTKVLRRRLTP